MTRNLVTAVAALTLLMFVAAGARWGDVALAQPRVESGRVPPRSPLLGAWRCTIDEYEPFACRVRRVDGVLRLEKTTGSQRFEGTITEGPTSFEFEGRFFCPRGACDGAARATFVRRGAEQVYDAELAITRGEYEPGGPPTHRVVLFRGRPPRPAVP